MKNKAEVNELYQQMRNKYANMLAVILSIAIVFSSLTFPLAPTASAADPLPAPQNVKVTGVTHKSVTLAWDPVDGVDSNSGYQVWYANGGWAAWTGDPTVTVTGLNPNTTYSFYVTAIVASNDRSTLVTAITDELDPNAYPEPPLSPPHNLVISDITQSEIKLSWTGSPGAAGYDMYVNNRWTGGIWNGSNSFTYSVPKSVTGTVYFEVAGQITPSNVSVRSNRVTIKWGELSQPADLKIVSATRSSVALGWAPTPGATEYDIYEGATVIGSTYSNRYVATALTEGESYNFNVVAKNKLWESPASDVITAVPGSHYNIVTYYTSWARSPNERNYPVENVDASKLTHINYAFADLCWKEAGSRGRVCEDPDIPLQDRYVFDGEMVLGDPTQDEINIRDLQALKAVNPNLNLMISVGGWSWSKNFSNMANTEVNRRIFANSAVKFLREYKFDGLDIDWEYPVVGGDIDNSRRPEDKQNYTLLMKTVREALDAAGSEDGKYYLLTIASYQGQSFVDNADLANSSKYLDFINMMTYDYSGNWNTSGYHNAPLFYDPASPSAGAKRNNVVGGATGHLNGGVPNYKLVLGVPFFGNGWTGCQAKGEYVPCAEFAQFGTWENGKFDIYDIEDVYLKDKDYVRYWNESAKVPYLYNEVDGTFISYDDTESMMYKASLVKTLDLAGVMSWDITGDRNASLSTQLANDLPIDGVANTNALAAPQNVVSMSKTDTTVNVGWDAVAGATGYDVFANKVWHGYTATTRFDITKLTPNSENTIEIIAIDKDNTRIERVSAMSKPLKEMTNLDGPLPAIVDTDAEVQQITSMTATAGGNITSDSGFVVTERGIVYSTNANPTIADGKIRAASGGIGAFTVNLAGLQSGSTYHVRAYAVNAIGVSYGQEITFATLSSSASLNSLNLSGIHLDQAVSGNVYDYTASVPNSLSSFTVTATVSDATYGSVTASVYNGGNTLVAGPISLASGASSTELPLEVGSNRIELIVIAQDGTGTKYTVMITRAKQDNGSVGSGNGGGSNVVLTVISTNGKLTIPVGQAGEVRLDNGLVIFIPVNATSKELKLTIEKLLDTKNLLSNNEILASSIYEVLKNFQESFSKRVTLTFVFDPVQLKTGQTVAIFYYDEVKKVWVKVNGGKINGNRITADVDHFTKFAVLVVDQATGLPIIDSSTESTTGAQFSDISGHWAEADIKQAVSDGIVKGYTDGTFKPNATVTRAEFAVMLMNALKPTGKGVELSFTDSIPVWAQTSIAQALEADIVRGYEDKTFRPNASISRSELVVMIARAVGVDGAVASSTGFADDSKIPTWAKGAIAAVKKLGIVSGRDGNLVAPTETATRAEAVTIIMNLLQTKE
jgi:GH18 family chitinase